MSSGIIQLSGLTSLSVKLGGEPSKTWKCDFQHEDRVSRMGS
jgi:hypothetical protein